MRLILLLAALALAAADLGALGSSDTVLKTEELWRRGGERDTDADLFGVITDVEFAPNGDVYVLDMQRHDVKVFSQGGRFLRSFGRSGEGPGEFRNPTRLMSLGGDRIAVLQSSPQKISIFSTAGEYVEELRVVDQNGNPFNVITDGTALDSGLLLHTMNFVMADGKLTWTHRIILADRWGAAVSVIDSARAVNDLSKNTMYEDHRAPIRWARGGKDSVIITKGSGYELVVHNIASGTSLRLRRDYRHRKRSEAEKQWIEDWFLAGGGAASVDVRDHDRDIQWFGMDEFGTVWVLTSRALDRKPGEAYGFDLFDSSGEHVGALAVMLQFDIREDQLYMKDGGFVVVTQFESAFRSWRRGVGSGRVAAEDETERELIGMEVVSYGFQLP